MFEPVPPLMPTLFCSTRNASDPSASRIRNIGWPLAGLVSVHTTIPGKLLGGLPLHGDGKLASVPAR